MANNDNPKVGLVPFEMALEMRELSNKKRKPDKTTETIILMQIAYYISIAKFNDYCCTRLNEEKLKELFPNYYKSRIYKAIDYLINEGYLLRIWGRGKKPKGDYCLTVKAGNLIKKHYWIQKYDNINFHDNSGNDNNHPRHTKGSLLSESLLETENQPEKEPDESLLETDESLLRTEEEQLRTENSQLRTETPIESEAAGGKDAPKTSLKTGIKNPSQTGAPGGALAQPPVADSDADENNSLKKPKCPKGAECSECKHHEICRKIADEKKKSPEYIKFWQDADIKIENHIDAVKKKLQIDDNNETWKIFAEYYLLVPCPDIAISKLIYTENLDYIDESILMDIEQCWQQFQKVPSWQILEQIRELKFYHEAHGKEMTIYNLIFCHAYISLKTQLRLLQEPVTEFEEKLIKCLDQMKKEFEIEAAPGTLRLWNGLEIIIRNYPFPKDTESLPDKQMRIYVNKLWEIWTSRFFGVDQVEIFLDCILRAKENETMRNYLSEKSLIQVIEYIDIDTEDKQQRDIKYLIDTGIEKFKRSKKAI